MLVMLASVAIFVTLIHIIEASCYYATNPEWYASEKYHYQLAVCSLLSTNPILSMVTFPNQYRVESLTSECKLIGNGSWECTSSGGFLSFDLFTPGNLNGQPSVTVMVNKEQCQFATSCSVVSNSRHKDKAMLSLGPFGTYPRAAAIGGLCAFCCVVLFGILLVYRRTRMYSNKNPDDPPQRRNLWQLICGRTHRETGSRFKKTTDDSKKPSTRAIPLKNKGDLEEGNTSVETTGFNSLSLGEFSVNELGSGMKSIPKSSVLTNLKEVQKPSSNIVNTTRNSVRRDRKIKGREHEILEASVRSATAKHIQVTSNLSGNNGSVGNIQNNYVTSSTEYPDTKKEASQVTTINESRIRNLKDDAKHPSHHQNPKRRPTTKGNEKHNRPTAVKDGENLMICDKGKRSSEPHHSINASLKVHRSKTIATKLRKAEDEKPDIHQDDTPLGLIRRNKTLDATNQSTAKISSDPQLAPLNEDNLPLLHPSLIRARTTHEIQHKRDSTSISEGLFYNPEISNTHKVNKS